MPHTNTVFRDILKLVPWTKFDRLVKNHGTDELVRSFTTKRQLLARLDGQLAGASSLRDIEADGEPSGAALSRGRRGSCALDLRRRQPRPLMPRFSRVFSCKCWAWPRVWPRPWAWWCLRRKMGDAVRLIDGASLHLAGAGAQWAKHRKCPSDAEGRFSADVCGAKAHVVHDRDQGCPIYHMVTNAKVNELVAAKTMPVEAGATSVFDLGYYDCRAQS